MTGSSTNGASNEVPKNNHSIAKDEIAKPRRLLIDPELAHLGEEQEKSENLKLNAENLSQVLPEAIAKRPLPDEALTEALLPTVENAIQASVRRDANIIATAIFPVLGSGIRKAVAAAISEMTQTLKIGRA